MYPWNYIKIYSDIFSYTRSKIPRYIPGLETSQNYFGLCPKFTVFWNLIVFSGSDGQKWVVLKLLTNSFNEAGYIISSFFWQSQFCNTFKKKDSLSRIGRHYEEEEINSKVSCYNVSKFFFLHIFFLHLSTTKSKVKSNIYQVRQRRTAVAQQAVFIKYIRAQRSNSCGLRPTHTHSW